MLYIKYTLQESISLKREGAGKKYVQKKHSRRRTTLPHTVEQYHRREASYRSCSGWGDVSFKPAIDTGGKYGIEGEEIFLFSDLLL